MPSDGEKMRRWLQDIRHYVLMAESFIEGLAYPDFANDVKTFLAVTRCLEIISEASRRLPQGFRAAHPEIRWREHLPARKRSKVQSLAGR